MNKKRLKTANKNQDGSLYIISTQCSAASHFQVRGAKARGADFYKGIARGITSLQHKNEFSIKSLHRWPCKDLGRSCIAITAGIEAKRLTLH